MQAVDLICWYPLHVSTELEMVPIMGSKASTERKAHTEKLNKNVERRAGPQGDSREKGLVYTKAHYFFRTKATDDPGHGRSKKYRY